MLKSFITILSVTLILSACATKPTPEEICSSEWVSKRTDKAMSEFSRDVQPMLKTLRKAGDQLKDGQSIGTFQMLAVSNAVQKLGKRVQKSRALKDLRLVGETCNDPKLVSNALGQFMEEQGAPKQAIQLLEAFTSKQPTSGT